MILKIFLNIFGCVTPNYDEGNEKHKFLIILKTEKYKNSNDISDLFKNNDTAYIIHLKQISPR